MKIGVKIETLERSLHDLGQEIPEDELPRSKLLRKLLTKVINLFCSNLQGEISHEILEMNDQELPAGANIKTIFSKLYTNLYSKNYASTKYTDATISRAILLSEGSSLSGFLSYKVFSTLIKPSLDDLTEPAFSCADEVYNCLEKSARESTNKYFGNFPELAEQIMLGFQKRLKMGGKRQSSLSKPQ